jgi:hypothetical protein
MVGNGTRRRNADRYPLYALLVFVLNVGLYDFPLKE